MAKKRRYDPAMSPTLLALKLQSMIAGRLGVPATDETVKQYLTFIANRYATGYSQYRALTLEVEAILNKNGVDSMLLGLYRSFAFEAYRAIQHGLPVDGIIQKYVTRARLDASILEEIVRAIGERVVKPASQAKAG
jgi:hypothetical protein